MDSDTAHDASFYKKMADLGWTGIAIPEDAGGQGMSYVDLAVLVEEMGRAVVPGPFFATVCLAAPVLVDTGRSDLLAGIASGERLATLAYTEQDGRVDAEGIRNVTVKDGKLTGTKHYVPDAHVADTLVVAARTR